MANQKITVLLVDDEPHIRKLMRALLESMGCEVVAEAGDGAQAVEQYRQYRPAITFLDINLPKLRGTESLKAIRDLNPAAFVIMLTTVSSLGVIQECLEAGAANFLRKDTPLEQMAREIRDSWKEYVEELKGD